MSAPSSAQTPITFLTVLRFAASYWMRQKLIFFTIVTLFTVAALLSSYLPTLLANFFSVLRISSTPHAIYYALALFLLGSIMHMMFFRANNFLYNHFETKLFYQIVDDAFTHLMRLSERYFSNTFTGSLVTRIKRGRSAIETFEDRILWDLYPTFTLFTVSTVLLAERLPLLGLLLGVFILIHILITIVLIFSYAGPAQDAYATFEDATGGSLADALSGISTTKSFARERSEQERFFSITSVLRTKNLTAYWRGSIINVIQHLLSVSMFALLLGGGAYYFIQGQAQIEDLAYLTLAYGILESHIRDIGNKIKELMTASYDLHGVIALLHETPDITDSPTARALPAPVRGDITFDSVTFTYPGKRTPAFRALSVTIPAGQRVALVGRSGSGKTTFIRLVQRLYDVQHGSISIDGHDLRTLTQHSLRSSIALVPQDPILFHRSIAENISFPHPRAARTALITAAKKACIHDFIHSLPEGYRTLVGERGVKLSGGERQRVAIARALLADRPLLILDEATSSLDSESEKAIQHALHILTQNRTSLIIAHRLSTIKDADRILVFDKGCIIEDGTHTELLRKKGLYARLTALQHEGFLP